MSQENVEIMRRVIERWNRGDLEGVLALFSADVECFPAAGQPESQSFRGRDGFAEYAKGWLDAFDTYALEASEYLDLGEYVVVLGRVVGRGRQSGAEVSADDAWLYRLRDGQVIEYRECGTKAKALEAVGLSE